MTVEHKRPIRIFAKDIAYSGTSFRAYSTGISSKNQDGTYNNAYMPVRFRRGIELEDKQMINILSAWLIPIKIKENQVVGLFINDFTLVEAKNTTNDNYNYEVPNTTISVENSYIDDLPF